MDQTKFKLYDKIVSLEKKVVVIDIGYRYTKFGISGDTQPRCIIPTVIKDSATGKPKSVFQYKKIDELYNNLVEFFQYLYFKRILLSPKDTKVIIVESLLSPFQLRETLAKVLFCHLQISSLLMVPSHMVALYTLAVGTALVLGNFKNIIDNVDFKSLLLGQVHPHTHTFKQGQLNIGYTEACLIPVYEGYPVLHAYQSAPLGGKAVEENIKYLLLEHYKKEDPSKVPLVESLSEKLLEDIKVRLCFVTTLERSQKMLRNENISFPPSVDYKIGGTQVLNIPGKVMEFACEVLFHLDADEISLATMVLNALIKCATDMRKPLSESILIMGGSASLRGIKSRLLNELKYLMSVEKFQKKLFCKTFKMHMSPSHENYTAWLGGSLVGVTEMVNMNSITKEEYRSKGDIPDWANLKYNVKQEDILK